jgi:RNA polymerase sigma-70 factor (subfamily 1)
MESATSTFDIIGKIKSGDEQAFSFLFEKYRPRLAVIIHYRLSPEQRRAIGVDDILQDTLMKGFRDFDQFTYQSPGSFLRWLSRIADHVITDLIRSQGRQKRHANEMLQFRSESNPNGPEPVDSMTPSRLLAENERLTSLLQTLDALPEDYRRAILLTKIEGLSTQEMSEHLGKSREAGALILHRALKRFRQLQQQRGSI